MIASSDTSDKGRTTARTVLILDAVALSEEGATLTEVAQHAGMSPSGAHRALNALITAGVATQDGPRGRYRLGPRVWNWAQSMPLESRLLSCSREALRDLNRSTGETVLFSLLRDERIWTIASYIGTRAVVATPTLEGNSELHATARGHVFLAAMDDAAIARIIRRTGLTAYTPETITSEEGLREAVRTTRRSGLAWSLNSVEMGASGVAAPVRGREGEIIACIGIAVPTMRAAGPERAVIEAELARGVAQIENNWLKVTSSPAVQRD